MNIRGAAARLKHLYRTHVGVWQVIHIGAGTMTLEKDGIEWKERISATVEEHTRTKRRRAYTENIIGIRRPLNLNLIELPEE